MQQLGSAFADDMHAQDLFGLAMEDQLQPPRGVAPNLPARHLTIIRHAHFVGNVLVGKFLLGLADEGDLRNGVNPVGIQGGVGNSRRAESEGGSQPALLHRHRGQAGKADHVAHGEDMRLLGAVLRVDRDAAARVGFDAGRGQVQLIHIALPAHGVEQRVPGNLLLALQVRYHAAVGRLLNGDYRLIHTHGDAVVAQVVGKSLHHFGVGELEQARLFFHQDHAHSQDGEHAGVFHADNAAAHDDQRLGQVGHLQDLIAVDDAAAVEGNLRRLGRLGAGGDHNRFGFVVGLSDGADDAQMKGIDELRHAGDQLDAVSRELRLGDIDFGLDHVLDPEQKIRHRDFLFHAVVDAVNVLVIITREMQHGLTHGLAGNGAGVDAASAERGDLFDQRDALPELRALDGGSLPGRPRADHDHVESWHA